MAVLCVATHDSAVVAAAVLDAAVVVVAAVFVDTAVVVAAAVVVVAVVVVDTAVVVVVGSAVVVVDAGVVVVVVNAAAVVVVDTAVVVVDTAVVVVVVAVVVEAAVTVLVVTQAEDVDENYFVNGPYFVVVLVDVLYGAELLDSACWSDSEATPVEPCPAVDVSGSGELVGEERPFAEASVAGDFQTTAAQHVEAWVAATEFLFEMHCLSVACDVLQYPVA